MNYRGGGAGSEEEDEYTDEEEEEDYTSSESFIEDVESQQVLRKRFMNKFNQRKALKHKDDFFLVMDENHDPNKHKMDLNTFLQQADKVKCLKKYTPYCIVVHAISNAVIPIEELNKHSGGGGDSAVTVDYRVQATLYHTQTKCFVSRTFKGPITGRNFVKHVKKDQHRIQETIDFESPLFFYSNIVDESVVLVVEFVALLRQKTVVVHEFGVGWTILRIFKEVKYGKAIEHLPKLIDYVSDDNFNCSREGPVYEGTPRILLHLQESVLPPPQLLEDQLNKKLGCKMMYSLFRHPPLQSSGAWSFFRSNDIISQKEFIPGIRFNHNKHQCDLVKPILSEMVQLKVSGISIKLPKQFEQQLLTTMKEQRRREHGEFFNPEREVQISKRVITIGSHNTFTYFQGPSESTLELSVKDQQQATNSDGGGDVLVLDHNFTLNYLPSNSATTDYMCGILFEIQYIFEVPLPLGEFKRSFMDKLKGSNKNKKTVPEVDFTMYSVVVGNFAFFPSAAVAMKSFGSIQEEVNTESGLSFSGKPTCKIPVLPSSSTITTNSSTAAGENSFLIKFNYEKINSSGGNTEPEKAKPQLVKQQSIQIVDEDIKEPITPPPPTTTTVQQEEIIEEEQPVPEPIVDEDVAIVQPIEETNEEPNVVVVVHEEDLPPPEPLIGEEVETVGHIPQNTEEEVEEVELEAPTTPKARMYEDYVLEQLSTPGSDLDGIEVKSRFHHYNSYIREDMIELGRSRDLTKEISNHMNSLKFNEIAIENGKQLLVSDSPSKEVTSADESSTIAHNLYINFLSFSPKQNVHFPSSIYFRFKLFTFSSTDTSKTPLFLVDPSVSFEQQDLAIYVLSLKDERGESLSINGGAGAATSGVGVGGGKYGLQLKFTLDPSTVTEEEYRNFQHHLEHDSLFIDVFNAETKFKFGVIRIPMNLFKTTTTTNIHNNNGAQIKEYDICEGMEGLINDEGFTTEGIKGQHLGSLYVSVCNVGTSAEFPGQQQNKFVKAKQKYEQQSKRKNPILTGSTTSLGGGSGPVQSLYEQYNFLTSLKEPTSRELELLTNEELRSFCREKMMSVMEYRRKEKSNSILHQIEDLMTSFRVIYASFGELSFFELPFQNIYSKDHAFTIEIEQSKSCNLSVVYSEEERMELSRYYQDWNCIQVQKQGNAPSFRFSMKTASQQLLRIPFKFQSFTELYEDSNVEEIRVLIKNSNGSTLHVCKIRVVPRNFSCGQNLEFNHPVESVGTSQTYPFKKKLRYSQQDFGHENIENFFDTIIVKTTGKIYASTSSYSNNSSITSIELKTTLSNTTPSTGYILIYGDQYCHKLIEIWKVTVNPIETLILDVLIGQTTYTEYFIPSKFTANNNGNTTNKNVHVRFDSSLVNDNEMSCDIAGGEELKVEYTPPLNSETGTRHVLFHVLDGVGTQTKLLAKYFFKINIQHQQQSKTYNHVIPVNSTEKLKLSFVNTEQRTQDYTITTNHPELLGLKVEEVTLQPSQRHVIYMKFFPCFTIGSAEILLYINRKEDNQTVKCLGINVKYQ